MLIKKPNKIALCFVGGDLNRTSMQIKDLAQSFLEYEVEIWSRAQKTNAQYLSFSQLINEAIVDTDAEFMVFINPKTIPTPDLVNKIIKDLCSGYCFSARVSFGMFGATKELFRHIGLFDENFIGGEYEDDDIGLRLKRFGKAIVWNFEYYNYPWTDSPVGKWRGLSRSYFITKWKEVELNKYALNTKINWFKALPKRIQQNHQTEISDSWMVWSKSHLDKLAGPCIRTDRAEFIDNLIFEELRVDGNIEVKLDQDIFRLEFYSDADTEISFQLVKAETGNEIPLIERIDLRSNHWYEIPFHFDADFELRIYHAGSVVFYNPKINLPYHNQFKIGLITYRNI